MNGKDIVKMETDIKKFLESYIGKGNDKSDIVTQYAVDGLLAHVNSKYHKGLKEKIIEYGTKNPDAPFWDFLDFIEPGLHGVTMEELMEDEAKL